MADESSRAKILIVEDEEDARMVFVELLESEDKYDVSSSANGDDALAKAAAEKFDLILLDIVMPNKDGIEVLQQIKQDEETYGNPIIVMLTNISGDAAVEKALELGAVGYKLKSGTEPEELLEDIDTFLAGGKQDMKTDPVSKSLEKNLQESRRQERAAAA